MLQTMSSSQRKQRSYYCSTLNMKSLSSNIISVVYFYYSKIFCLQVKNILEVDDGNSIVKDLTRVSPICLI